jgi:mannose-6-phosphate isomerase-like protein (cupin superfamily)
MTEERRLPVKRSCDTTPERRWGSGGVAWDLVSRHALRVTRERMTAGAAEDSHAHAVAHQVFYVLDGSLTVVRAGQMVTVAPGEAIEVPPGVVPQVLNNGASDVEFLVVASPTTDGDRRDTSSRDDQAVEAESRIRTGSRGIRRATAGPSAGDR